MIRLVIKDREGGEASFPVVKLLLIGRSRKCDLRFNDSTVSREHARVLCEGRECVLENLSTANGTRINGSPVLGKVVIRHGDLIQVGEQKIRVISLDRERGQEGETTTMSHGDVARALSDVELDPVKKAWREPINPRVEKPEILAVGAKDSGEPGRLFRKGRFLLLGLAGLSFLIIFFFLRGRS